jgi:hypothetical protein
MPDHPVPTDIRTNFPNRSAALKKLGQAPSRPPISQGFRSSRAEPVPFFPNRSAALARRVPFPVHELLFVGIAKWEVV